MFVVLTPEQDFPSEAELLHYFASFEQVRVHIRKPQKNNNELCSYLGKISRKTLKKSCLHSFFELGEQFEIAGVHFTSFMREQQRTNLQKNVRYWKEKGKRVSASLHSLEEVSALWDYAFLSPVFDSISKQNYGGKQFVVREKQQQLIALGGIRIENIKTAKALGYSGIAVLGSVWKQENPKQTFDKLYNEYEKYFA